MNFFKWSGFLEKAFTLIGGIFYDADRFTAVVVFCDFHGHDHQKVAILACGCAPEGVDVNRLYKNLLLTAILFSVSAFVVSYLEIYTKLFL